MSNKANRMVFQGEKLDLYVPIHVPGEGIEPSRDCSHRFLRPTRLPIPPPRLMYMIGG